MRRVVATPRQLEVAELVAKGFSYKAIAERKGIKRRTVLNHVHEVARRLDGIKGRPRDKVTIWFLSLREAGDHNL
jgi:DNA-binding CsgD family transcriptional regulator